jgi:integrase/recombinase XerD
MKKREKQNQFSPINERIKYQYLCYLKRVLRKDEKTTFKVLEYLRVYELFTNFAGFETYDGTQADKFIDHLTDEKFSSSFIGNAIRDLREFLTWLQRKKGYRSKIDYDDIGYLNISDNQRRAAKAVEHKKSYTYEQIIKTIRKMPESEMIERRNRAMISLNALCGLRISELRTVKIKNLIFEDEVWFVYVNPKDMKSKNATTRRSPFVQLPQDITNNVINWKIELEQKHGFKDKDPLFPKIPRSFNWQNLLESRVKKEEINSTSAIRNVFESSFKAADLPYINPHNFRHTRARFAAKQSPEYLNATRQALGHKSIDTTLNSYGELSFEEQKIIIGKVSIS